MYCAIFLYKILNNKLNVILIHMFPILNAQNAIKLPITTILITDGFPSGINGGKFTKTFVLS